MGNENILFKIKIKNSDHFILDLEYSRLVRMFTVKCGLMIVYAFGFGSQVEVTYLE